MIKREETTISGPPGTTCRSSADFENAGVGIVINSVLMPSLRDIKQINGRIIVATFEAQGSPVSFICAYAPHSGHNIEEKEGFYDQLSNEISQLKGCFYVGGDFNARIHYVRDSDKDVCGPNIVGRGMQYLYNMNEATKENRALFLGFCKSHNLLICNSQFSKPPDKLVTYKEKVPTDNDSRFNGPPYDAVKSAQIDYWLCGVMEKRTVLDTQGRLDIHFDSDHFPLECYVVINIRVPQEDVNSQAIKYAKPDPHNWATSNQKVRSLLEGKSWDLESCTNALIEAAASSLQRESPQKKRKVHSTK